MSKTNVLWIAVALFAASCDKPADSGQGSAEAPISSEPVPQPSAPAAPSGFSIDSVPISNAPLGAFPYFSLPARYAEHNKPVIHEFGRFPFWTGAEFQQVEGHVYMVNIVGKTEADYSAYELKRNMQALFSQAGAVKIAEGRIPTPIIMALPAEERQDINSGFGDPYNNPVETWVIHRPDKDIWIHFAQDSSSAGLSIVETKPFVATAALLPADAIEQSLDQTGKAVLHINFETDKSAILSSSESQIKAVVELLKRNPNLKLAINGYTDETGSLTHNLQLSDARAKAVMAALSSAGVAPDRLQARGYGAANPIAANTDEAGKAQNRRVELIKL